MGHVMHQLRKKHIPVLTVSEQNGKRLLVRIPSEKENQHALNRKIPQYVICFFASAVVCDTI